MMHVLSLESFDETPEDAPAGMDAFQEGFLAGFSQAEVEAEGAQDVLQAELVQAISDLQFTYVEARADFIQSVRPLFAAISESILPDCVDATFYLHIVDTLAEAAKINAAGKMTVALNPAQVVAFQAAIAQSPLETQVIADPHLGTHAASVTHQSGEVLIDLDHLSGQITDILSAISETHIRSESNG